MTAALVFDVTAENFQSEVVERSMTITHRFKSSIFLNMSADIS
jgi:hypothetical protein